jgi:hypothetical protein
MVYCLKPAARYITVETSRSRKPSLGLLDVDHNCKLFIPFIARRNTLLPANRIVRIGGRKRMANVKYWLRF